MKYLIILLISLSLYSQEYDVLKDNNKVAFLKSLDTIEKGYLIAETTKLAYIFLGFNENVVLYDSNKPNAGSSKYIKDTHGFLKMIKTFKNIDYKKGEIVENNKYLFNIKCKSDICSYKGLYKDTITMLTGSIKFDKGIISELTNNEMQMILRKKS